MKIILACLLCSFFALKLHAQMPPIACEPVVLNDPSLSPKPVTATGCEPLIAQSNELMIYGTGNYDFVAQEVMKFKVKPVQIGEGKNKKALILLNFDRFYRTNINASNHLGGSGNYDEFGIYFLVEAASESLPSTDLFSILLASGQDAALSGEKNDGSKEVPPTSAPKLFAIPLKLVLSSADRFALDFATIEGIVRYGYPKGIGKIDFAPQSSKQDFNLHVAYKGNSSGSVQDPESEGSFVFDLSFRIPLLSWNPDLSSLPRVHQYSVLLTPLKTRSVWTVGEFTGVSTPPVPFWSGFGNVAFTVHPHAGQQGFLEKKIVGIGFEPKYVIWIPQKKMFFYTLPNLAIPH